MAESEWSICEVCPHGDHALIQKLGLNMTKFKRPADLPGRVCRVLMGLVDDWEDPFQAMVYRFAHIASGRYGNEHKGWLEEFERVELEVEERYYTSPRERMEREANPS